MRDAGCRLAGRQAAHRWPNGCQKHTCIPQVGLSTCTTHAGQGSPKAAKKITKAYARGCDLPGVAQTASGRSLMCIETKDRKQRESEMAWEEFEHGWRLAPAVPPADAPARALVVLLHGVGSNAQDLLPLAD